MPFFRKSASAPELPSSKSRFWRRNKSKAQPAVRKKRELPKIKNWRIAGAEKFAVAKAHLQERLSHLSNWIYYQLYAIAHPCSPLRRRAAKRSKSHSHLGATERRTQKEAKAKSRSANRRITILEKRMAKDAETAKLLK